MLLVVLTALLATTPPLVPAPPTIYPPLPPPSPSPYEDPPRQPIYAPPAPYYPPTPQPIYVPSPIKKRPPPEPLAPATLGLFFAPLSLFSLTFWVEGDLALIGGLDLFMNVGGGPLGQFGFDAGLRYYVNGASLEGWFISAYGSGFSLPGDRLWMFGPGFQLGHGWRIQRFTLSIALGVTTWYAQSRAKIGNIFIFGATTDADVIVFPGVTQPPGDRGGVQPTIRVSLGPWF